MDQYKSQTQTLFPQNFPTQTSRYSRRQTFYPPLLLHLPQCSSLKTIVNSMNSNSILQRCLQFHHHEFNRSLIRTILLRRQDLVRQILQTNQLLQMYVPQTIETFQKPLPSDLFVIHKVQCLCSLFSSNNLYHRCLPTCLQAVLLRYLEQ